MWHELANLVWEVFWQDRDSDQLRFDLGQSRAERDMALLWWNAAVGTLCAAGVRTEEKHGQTGIHRIGHGNRDGGASRIVQGRTMRDALQRNRLRPLYPNRQCSGMIKSADKQNR